MVHNQQIVFFDGVCNLCNRFVDFLMRRDKNRKLMYASLQGSCAARLLNHDEIASLSTVIYLRNGEHLRKSDAVIQILRDLGWQWQWVVLFKVLPRRLRDSVYDIVAKQRYKRFGRRETCRVPTPDERAQFPD